jgi:hypothetical protein
MKPDSIAAPSIRKFDRRQLCHLTGVIALTTVLRSRARAEAPLGESASDPVELHTGNGGWTYRVVLHWGDLPQGQVSEESTVQRQVHHPF